MDNKTLKRIDIRVEMEGQGGINYDDDYCLIHSKPCDSVEDDCMFFDYDW